MAYLEQSIETCHPDKSKALGWHPAIDQTSRFNCSGMIGAAIRLRNKAVEHKFASNFNSFNRILQQYSECDGV